MRIENLNIDSMRFPTKGISNTNLTRLGTVVALVGRNGSGKSRTLEILENSVIKYSSVLDVTLNNYKFLPEKIIDELNKVKNEIDGFRLYCELKESRELLASQSTNEEYIRLVEKSKSNFEAKYPNPAIKMRTREFTQVYGSIKAHLKDLFPKFIRKINYNEIQNLLKVINDNKESNLSFESLIENVTDLNDYDEFSSIHFTALTYLSRLPHQLVDDLDDCYGDENKFHLRESFKRYSSLKTMIRNFLNKDLTWEKSTVGRTLKTDGVHRHSMGIWKLQGREFDYEEFSSGEKTLFAYCLLFFLLDQNPEIRIKECVIIIDEPELHLHPESELAIIRSIRKLVQDKGQLWIATHSISILSDLEYDEIFMLKDNTIISPGSSTPSKSLTELMGLDEHIEKLSQFIGNISNWAFINFITQCFSSPEVIQSARPNDPEVLLFKEFLTHNPTITILDYGAGKGRILKEIIANSSELNKFELYALEPDENNISFLKDLNLEDVYQNYSQLPIYKFDVILLSNVLHEIPINDWASVLNAIKKSLKEDGYLIIMEDMLMPKGEKIGEIGFIVLDSPSIKELFSLEKLPGQIESIDKRYKDRILCTVIQNRKLQEVNNHSISKSLGSLKKSILTKTKNLRKTSITAENKLKIGREAAFYSALYMNTEIALIEIANK